MAVTLRDIADSVGVSRQVVATVLSGRGSARAGAETRTRILAAARALNYQPNASARSLATGKTCNIELQAHVRGDSLYHLPQHHLPLWASVAMYCQERHHNLILASRRSARDEGLFRNLRARNLDGLVILAVADYAVLEEARSSGIPVVCCTPTLPSRELAQADFEVVNFDNAGGIRAAVEYLVSLGHRDIGFVQGQSFHHDFEERWRAFQSAMADHGLALSADRVWQAIPRLEGGEAVGAQVCAARSRPTAILAASDNLALGLMRTLQAGGVRVPGEISVMGFDNTDAARVVWPGLTTVHLDWRALGTMAADRLFAAMNGDPATTGAVREHRYPVTLIERQSCRPLGIGAA
jgi:DNA-binding LacI/PurR family transcriptional regulator